MKLIGPSTKRLVASLTSIALILAFSEQVRAENMSGEEIKALLENGLTLRLGEPAWGYTGSLRLEPDGTGAGAAKTDNGTKLDITGTWTIEGDQFCRKWAFNAFKKTCEVWRRSGENRVYVIVDGKTIGVNTW